MLEVVKMKNEDLVENYCLCCGKELQKEEKDICNSCHNAICDAMIEDFYNYNY